jgi:hypothetical protein
MATELVLRVLAGWAVLSLACGAVWAGLSALAKHRRRQIAATPALCHCGQPIPAGLVAYCTRACRWADDDHGPNGDDQ